MTKIMPVYPNKRVNGGNVGYTQSCPLWPWVTHILPTDGSGYIYPMNPYPSGPDDRTAIESGASNDLQYIIDHGWDYLILLDPVSGYNYQADYDMVTHPPTGEYGPGNTRLDDWIATYIDFFNAHGIKWWCEIDIQMVAGEGYVIGSPPVTTGLDVAIDWNMPPTDKSWYRPGTGYPTSYENMLGPAIDRIEHESGLQGYTFEMAFQNGVQWLHDKTNRCISQKDWSCYVNETGGISNSNALQGTDADGNAVVATPAERVALLDEIVFEYFKNVYQTSMIEFIQLAQGAGKKVMMNIDVVGNDVNAALEDYGNWAGDHFWGDPGVGQPNNRAWYERVYFLQRSDQLYQQLGPFDGIIWNAYDSLWPLADAPDIAYHLKFCDTMRPWLAMQAATLKVPVNGTTPNVLNFTLLANQTPAQVALQFYDYQGSLTYLPEATMTWTVSNITKSTSDNTIYNAHPMFSQQTITWPLMGWQGSLDVTPPSYIIRLLPEEIASLRGQWSHNLSLTVRDPASNELVTRNYRGLLNVASIRAKPMPTTTLRSIVHDKVTLQRSGGRPWM